MSPNLDTSVVTRAGREGFTGSAPVEDRTFTGQGVVLRPWERHDATALRALYDTDEMDRWTPVPHPFTLADALAHIARSAPRAGSRRLVRAITEDLCSPLGEAVLVPSEEPGSCDLGYAVSPGHRGRGLARRALEVLLPVAVELGYRRARLRIVVGNRPSEAVAVTAGFRQAGGRPCDVVQKGRSVPLTTWTRRLDP